MQVTFFTLLAQPPYSSRYIILNGFFGELYFRLNAFGFSSALLLSPPFLSLYRFLLLALSPPETVPYSLKYIRRRTLANIEIVYRSTYVNIPYIN
jgi:hypothetical protein